MSDYGRIIEVPIDQIEIGENIRKSIDEHELKGLAISIRENEVMIPVELVPGETLPYKLMDGGRRLAAAALAGRTKIIGRLHDRRPTEGERLGQQLVIQCQRSDLNPMDLSHAMEAYLNANGFSQSQAAVKLGFSNAAVTRGLKRLTLAAEVQEYVRQGKIAASTADALASIEDTERQIALARRAVAGQLTRDEAMNEARAQVAAAGTKAKEVPVTARPAVESAGPHQPPQSSVKKLKVSLPDGSVTISSASLSPEVIIGLLGKLLARARKLSAKGTTAEDFFRSLKNAVKHA